MRFIDISIPASASKRVISALSDAADASWSFDMTEQGRCDLKILSRDEDIQTIVDRLQSVLAEHSDWRIVILPVEAAITSAQALHPDRDKGVRQTTALREEIYQDVASGAHLNSNFVALSVLSAIVAAMGLNADNVAVVIGAMVIAPLLGPLLAFSFGSALGDLTLMLRAAGTALAGVTIGIVTTLILSQIIPVNIDSNELTSRTIVGLDSVALALASGAAAALSIVSGLSSTLVGVMVAVALLPPSAAFALYLGVGETSLALKAAFLLCLNVICVNIASQVVFFVRGVRPRTWLEQRAAKRSRRVNMLVWGGLLIAIIAIITFRPG